MGLIWTMQRKIWFQKRFEVFARLTRLVESIDDNVIKIGHAFPFHAVFSDSLMHSFEILSMTNFVYSQSCKP